MGKHIHLVFYDGECGLCDQVVQLLIKIDKQQVFDFAPLQGVTATRYLKDVAPELKNIDSLIVIENYKTNHSKIHVLAQAVFRIFWLLGGKWSLIGWLSFLPSFLFNWMYRLVARNRHYFFSQNQCFLPSANQKDRFLP